MAILNKNIHFTKMNKPFAVISASYLESLENVIFVEAYKIEHVREAIDGLNMCYQKISILNPDEMTKIYENLD